MDSAIALQAVANRCDKILHYMEGSDSNGAADVQRHLVALTALYKNAKGNDPDIKAQVKQALDDAKTLKIAAEDELLSVASRRKTWANLERSVSKLRQTAKEKLEQTEKAISIAADEKVSAKEIVQQKVKLMAITSKPSIKSLAQLDKEISTAGGLLSVMKEQLTNMAGPVGLSRQHLAKTPETSRLLQETNHYEDDSHTRKFLDENSKNDYAALSSVQAALAKLPKQLSEGETTRIVKGPVFVCTSPIITKAMLDRVHIKGHQLFPGWILEDQLLLAYNPKADVSNLTVAHKAKRQGKVVHVNKAATVEDRAQDVIDSLNARSHQHVMDVTDGQPLRMVGNKLKFLWLLPVAKYEGLGQFSIDTIGFPVSKELIDPDSKSRPQHEHDLKLHLAKEKTAKDAKLRSGAARRQAMEKAVLPLLKTLEELEKKENDYKEKRKAALSELAVITTAVDSLRSQLNRATAQEKRDIHAKITKALVRSDTIGNEVRTLEESEGKKLREEKTHLRAEIEAVKQSFRS